jgi:hypothetical protein
MDDNSELPVIEVRTYRARDGQREQLMTLMRELAFPVQRQLGMKVLGPIPSLEDEVTFVWLRAFPAAEHRDDMKRAFYEGPEWTTRLEAQLMPLLADYTSVPVQVGALWQFWPSDAE